ncbi:MAG: VWA domain-containing protein [Deltaproteobacteria bacterium]|nr:MAG: VWA domain-containing protein [Deltaproteobacteria bacterium]
MRRYLPLSLGALVALLLGLAGAQGAMAQGFLIPTDRRIAPLAIKYHRVQVKIRDRAAQTRVEQVFVNSTSRVLEATYIFPLPANATISNFVLYINGKATKGKVLEKGRAAAIYQSIVRRMRDPGLLEYMGGRLFRARVFPIPRKGEQKISISFTQIVSYRNGMHRYVYPLKTPHKVVRTQNDFTMSLQLQTRTPLKNVYSPTHRVSVARRGERKAIVGFEKNQASLNRDFVLFYSVSPKAIGMNVLTHRVKGQNGYFLMMATPKVSYGSSEIVGKNITFVLDTSGSMSGKKMKWARRALQICLGKLNPKDHFNVVRFSTDVEGLFRGLQPANISNIKKAQAFVKRMEAAGGTAIDDAMKMALAQKPKGKGLNIVVLITDGHPTIGETTPSAILKNAKTNNKKKARVFTFGIGTSINTKLLDKLASQAGGTGDYVKPNKEISQRIGWFYDKVRYPVLSDIKMTVGGNLRLYDIYPKRIPDLFRGGQILLFGRYRKSGDVAIKLNGRVGGKQRRYVFESRFAKTSAKHDFIAKLWAHRKVAYLLENIRLRGANAELRNEVIRLAKKFGIVTPYTSYLVLERRDHWRYNNNTRGPLVQGQTRRRRRWRGTPRPGVKLDRFSTHGHGGGGAPSTATPAPAAPPSDDDAVANQQAFGSSSGKKAVEVSRKLAKAKRRKVVSAGGTRRYIQGRLFLWKRGQWVDQSYRSSMKTLKVKYLGRLYFRILKLRPDLRRIFALGQSVTVVVGKNKALVIGSTGSKVSSAKLKAFVKR